MHIVIDARLYGLEHAGIGRYIKNLTQHLFAIDSENHYSLLLRHKYFYSLHLPQNVTKILVDIKHYSLREQIQLPTILNSLKPDLVHFPHFNVPLFYRQKSLVTIHDILWHQFKGTNVTTLPPALYYLKYFGYRAVVHHAVHLPGKITVPSRWVKRQLLAQFTNLPASKIQVIYEGVDPALDLQSSPQNQVQKKLDSAYLLYVGSCYPHKNVSTLLEALKIYNTQAKPLKLVIVSARNVFLNAIKAKVEAAQLTDHVIFKYQVSDSNLVSYYASAFALVLPSLSEGFGLTGLEAMAAGCPVIAAHAGSLPEVYGPAALYFLPSSVPDLVRQLKTLNEIPSLRSQLVNQGYLQVKKYSWKSTAQKTLSLYL